MGRKNSPTITAGFGGGSMSTIPACLSGDFAFLNV